VSTLAPPLGVHVGFGHCCHTEVRGIADGPGSSLLPTPANTLQTPDGSEAANVRGHGSPGGFQIHSPGRFWYQRLPAPSGETTGPFVSLAVSLIELSAIWPAPEHAYPGAHWTVNPQYGLAKVGSDRLVVPPVQEVPPPEKNDPPTHPVPLFRL
jgi:hypothetical protein